MRNALLILIRGYQWILRPLIGPSCRFYPSCSCYAHQAIRRHGAWRGLRMAASRLSRCHPWNEGGYDPVDPSPATSSDIIKRTIEPNRNRATHDAAPPS